MLPVSPPESSPEQEFALAFGIIKYHHSPEALVAVLLSHGLDSTLRESVHATGTDYVLLKFPTARIAFERTSELEYLLRGEAQDAVDLTESCSLVSQALQCNGIGHSIEVYSSDEHLLSTLGTKSEV